MIQQPTLPVQQAAVQQQMQQTQMPAYPVSQAPEFNAIKINITGANVTAPSQVPNPIPADLQQSEPKINYIA